MLHISVSQYCFTTNKTLSSKSQNTIFSDKDRNKQRTEQYKNIAKNIINYYK